ncbi:MAG: toll/interleukin-1 receptor domain-containing protein [Pseudomonadota bacterium]
MGENADTNPGLQSPASAGEYDVYLAYTDADEDIAKALQQELHRQKPGLRIWREKKRIGVGDAFNQAADMAISGCSVVLAIWTKHAARSGAFTLEARRAMTLRKPFVNLLAEIPTSALAPPYSKYSAFEIDEVFAMAGRSEGWLPPARPHKDDLEDELKPVLDRVSLHMRQNGDQASAIADGLITGVIDAAGEPHTAKFETLVKSIAPGDPATAIEVLGLAAYSEAEINTLVSPQSVRIASKKEDEKPLPWGAWFVRPQVRKVEAVQKDNGMVYALGGFLVAGLGALALWVMGSTINAPLEDRTSGPLITAGTDPSESADGTNGDSLLPPARNAATLENCALNSDGSITGAPCRLSANIAPLLGPDAVGPATGIQPASGDVEPTLDACIVSLGGAIENAPCRLNARYVPPSLPVPDVINPPCISEPDGSIQSVPCTLEGVFEAPAPEQIEVEVPVEPEPIQLCAVNTDGSIDDTPCTLVSALPAPEPDRIEVLVPADAPEREACIVSASGAIENAPCLLSSPVDAPAPERIEVPGERVVEVEDLPVCTGLVAGREVEEGCKLDEPIRLAYETCNSDTSNAPCTIMQPRTRFASDDEFNAPAPVAGLDTSRPATASVLPRRGDFPPRPLNMPANLEPCEDVINVPCRFTVEKAGLDTLTEIAEVYYGNTQAWCRIYRANQNTFGSRNRSRQGSNPNCIFMSDVFDLPDRNADNRYSLRECPPPQTSNFCGPPAQ